MTDVMIFLLRGGSNPSIKKVEVCNWQGGFGAGSREFSCDRNLNNVPFDTAGYMDVSPFQGPFEPGGAQSAEGYMDVSANGTF